MFRQVNNLSIWHRFSYRSGWLVVAVLFALLPSLAQAQCTQWDVSGSWYIKINSGLQKGGVAHVTFRQSGEVIMGQIDYNFRLGIGTVGYGSSIKGNDFGLNAKWDTKTYGSGTDVEYYVGKVGPMV